MAAQVRYILNTYKYTFMFYQTDDVAFSISSITRRYRIFISLNILIK